jgi:hypothetical protein
LNTITIATSRGKEYLEASDSGCYLQVEPAMNDGSLEDYYPSRPRGLGPLDSGVEASLLIVGDHSIAFSVTQYQ